MINVFNFILLRTCSSGKEYGFTGSPGLNPYENKILYDIKGSI